jgi:hypothetical protein
VWREKEAGDTKGPSRKRTSSEAGLERKHDELADTASSPLKSVCEGDGSENGKAKVQKQLLLGYEEEKGSMGDGVPPPPPAYIPPKELKKQKKMVKNSSEMNIEAGSNLGRRQ